jgi:hypothetical protein
MLDQTDNEATDFLQSRKFLALVLLFQPPTRRRRLHFQADVGPWIWVNAIFTKL